MEGKENSLTGVEQKRSSFPGLCIPDEIAGGNKVCLRIVLS